MVNLLLNQEILHRNFNGSQINQEYGNSVPRLKMIKRQPRRLQPSLLRLSNDLPSFLSVFNHPEIPLWPAWGIPSKWLLRWKGGAPEGTVVHLFAGDRLQGVRNTQPYLFQWEIQEIGDFLITAHAFREDGSVIQSANRYVQVFLIHVGK
jgi:hypothetical protein